MSYDQIFDDIQELHESWNYMHTSITDSLRDNPLVQFFSHPFFRRLFTIVAFLFGSLNVWLDFIFQSSSKSFFLVLFLIFKDGRLTRPQEMLLKMVAFFMYDTNVGFSWYTIDLMIGKKGAEIKVIPENNRIEDPTEAKTQHKNHVIENEYNLGFRKLIAFLGLLISFTVIVFVLYSIYYYLSNFR